MTLRRGAGHGREKGSGKTAAYGETRGAGLGDALDAEEVLDAE